MKPCDCKDINDTITKLNEAGISFNEYGILVKPTTVEIKIPKATIIMPMKIFEKLARWYLEDQEVTND